MAAGNAHTLLGLLDRLTGWVRSSTFEGVGGVQGEGHPFQEGGLLTDQAHLAQQRPC